jgi:biopolymer transport protein ExbB
MSTNTRAGLTGILIAAGLAAAAFAQTAPSSASVASPAPAAAAASPATPLRQERQTTLLHLIKAGGWAMWPLGACSVATLSLILLNFQRVNRVKMVPPVVVAQVRGAISAGDVAQAFAIANASDSLYARSVASGLRQYRHEDPLGSRKKMEEAIAEAASREETRYAFYVNFLALLTSMSPMWGLLGTVSGMIGAFSKIGGGGMGKPEILAKNISEALVCTATGLMIAIAAMGFYFLFRNILNNVMKESEAGFSEMLDQLTGQGGAFAEVAAAAAVPAGKIGPGTTI